MLRACKWTACAFSIGVGVGLLAPSVARAQDALPGDFSLEVQQSPVLGPSYVIGMAGASTALAVGVDGVTQNTAAPAVRNRDSISKYEWDATLGLTFPGAFGRSDVLNRGPNVRESSRDRTTGAISLNFGAGIQYGPFGAAVFYEQTDYSVGSSANSNVEDIRFSLSRTRLSLGYDLYRQAILLGVGVRSQALTIEQSSVLEDPGAASVRRSLTFTGFAPEIGVIVKPTGQRFRLALTYRAPAEARPLATQSDATLAAPALAIPRSVIAPSEFEFGAAWEFLERPMNPSFEPHDEAAVDLRAQLAAVRRGETLSTLERDVARFDARVQAYGRVLARPRRSLVLALSVLVTGASANAISILGFLDRDREIAGSNFTVSPRVGLQTEILANRLVLRGGTYLEPSRFSDGAPRVHATAGFDLHLVDTEPLLLLPRLRWALVGSADIAARYRNVGLMIGLWH